MATNEEQAYKSCVQCETLTTRWIQATEQLSRSVGELTGKMGTVPKHIYDSLYRSAEESRRAADEVEAALSRHRQKHRLNFHD